MYIQQCHLSWLQLMGITKKEGFPVGDNTLQKDVALLLSKQTFAIDKKGDRYWQTTNNYKCTSVNSYLHNNIRVISFSMYDSVNSTSNSVIVVPAPHPKRLGVETELQSLDPKITPIKEEKDKAPGRSVNQLGPIHWLTVSHVIKTSLYLDFWVSFYRPCCNCLT